MSLYVKKTQVKVFNKLLCEEQKLQQQYKESEHILSKVDKIYTTKAKEYAKVVRVRNDNIHCVRYGREVKDDPIVDSIFDRINGERLQAQANWISAKEKNTQLYLKYWTILGQLNELVGCTSDYNTWKFKSKI